jgi:hypothetical protein
VYLTSQSDQPIWGIGTKWTYELKPFYSQQYYTYLTNQIIDTTHINGRKLYVVESEPEDSGIWYLYYFENKAYNYNAQHDILELLYDFSETEEYQTNYSPICDPYFPYDSLLFKEYTILIDSIGDYTMPDNSIRTVQYAVPQDTLIEEMDTVLITDIERTILNGIGFLQGGIHYTHDWEIGMYICDEFANFVGQLRCFSNDTVSYNFVNYPCDSTYMISSVNEESHDRLNIFPNPTYENIYIRGVEYDTEFEIYSPIGMLLEKGVAKDRRVALNHSGLQIIRLNINGIWRSKVILKLD